MFGTFSNEVSVYINLPFTVGYPASRLRAQGLPVTLLHSLLAPAMATWGGQGKVSTAYQQLGCELGSLRVNLAAATL